MGKSGLPKRWSGGWQSLRLVIAALTIIAGGAFDEVLATPMQRVLSPDELLDHSQSRSGFVQTIATRADAALNGDSVRLPYHRVGRDEHAFRPDLAGAQGSQTQKLRIRRDGLAGTIVKDDGIDFDQQMTTGRAAHVLNGDGYRQGIARLDDFLPLLDQRDTDDHAPGSHALIEVLGEYQQIFSSNLVGLSGESVGVGGPLVGLGSGPQALIGDAIRLPGDIYPVFSQAHAVHRGLQSLSGLMQAHQQAGGAQDGQKKLRPGKRCDLSGPLGCSPLSAKIGTLLVCGLVAWCLIFRIFDLLDRRRRNWLLIIPLSAVAATLYLLPSYLVVGFPWNW